MQHEWLRAAERFHSTPALQVRLAIRRHFLVVVRCVEPCPLVLLRVPPHQLLPLAPRRPIRPRRRAVIQDANIAGPREAPAMSVESLRLAFVRLVLTLARHDAAVDPAAACGGSVTLQ